MPDFNLFNVYFYYTENYEKFSAGYRNSVGHDKKHGICAAVFRGHRFFLQMYRQQCMFMSLRYTVEVTYLVIFVCTHFRM